MFLWSVSKEDIQSRQIIELRWFQSVLNKIKNSLILVIKKYLTAKEVIFTGVFIKRNLIIKMKIKLKRVE